MTGHRWTTVVRTGAVALAVLSIVAGCGGGSSKAPAAVPAQVRDSPVAPLAWAPCGTFQCGSVTVPVDYRDPTGPGMTIAVIRERATDQSQRIGALVLNPGGPAVSGVGTLRATAGAFPAAVRARFDLVSFDPRGTGTSNRLVCGPAIPTATSALPVPAAGAPLPAVAAYRPLLAGCRSRNPSLLPFVTTANTARDMDRIRRAMGEPTLTYVGLSYGTLLGTEYLHLFPSRVRAMMLDAPIDPAESITAAAADQAAAAEAALPGTVTALFDEVQARLQAHALPAPGHGDTTPVTEGDLDLATLTYLSTPAFVPGYPAALRAALGGDGTQLRALAVDQFTDIDGSSVLAPYWTITCNDTAERPTALAAGDLARRLAAAYPRLGGEAVSFYLGACPEWSAAREPLRAVHATATTPVLVIGGTGDPVTPYIWARHLVTELGSASLLTRVGAGHTSFANGAGNACLADHETTYLVSLRTPPAGTRCG